MKTLLATLAILPAVLVSGEAMAAADGFTTGDVNMRAGPSTQYPRITVLPQGSEVRIYGCLRNRSWCDVGAYRTRGWVHSRYLSIFYAGGGYQPMRPVIRPPVVTFSFGYWDDWYQDRPFYHNRPNDVIVDDNGSNNDRPPSGGVFNDGNSIFNDGNGGSNDDNGGYNDGVSIGGSLGDHNDTKCVPSRRNNYCEDGASFDGGMIPEGGSVSDAVQGGFND